MDKSKEIKKLESQIAQGLTPRCPICGSNLKINKNEGTTGAKVYTYACLKEEDPGCTLKPGTAYVPWFNVLRHAATQRVVQLSIVVLGSLTVVGLTGKSLGFIKFDFGEEEADIETPSDKKGDTTQLAELKQIKDSLYSDNEALRKRVKELENTPRSKLSDEEKQFLLYGKYYLGINLINEKRSESKRYLFEVLVEYNQNPGTYSWNDDQKTELMNKISSLISKDRDIFEVAEIEKYIESGESGFSLKRKRYEQLGTAYYHLADLQKEKRKEFKRKSLVNFLKHVEFLLKSRVPEVPQYLVDNIKDNFDSLHFQNALPKQWDRDATMKNIRKAIKEKDLNVMSRLILDLEQSSS